MFIFSVKPKPKHLIWGGLVLLLILLAACLFSCRTEPRAQAAAQTDGSDNQKRIAFLAQYGWEVEEEPAESKDVAIPMEFGDVYQKYNEIQLSQGYDLEAYRGKCVKQYSYTVTNYPGVTDPVRANLLVYEGKIIGGDVCSLNLGGFMHGFSQKANAGSNG